MLTLAFLTLLLSACYNVNSLVASSLSCVGCYPFFILSYSLSTWWFGNKRHDYYYYMKLLHMKLYETTGKFEERVT